MRLTQGKADGTVLQKVEGDRFAPATWSVRGRMVHQPVQRDMQNQEEGEHTSFMQTSVGPSFAATLHDLLADLESMPKLKAARMANFLREMLRDQQRMSPHLRNPVLMARAESLQALVSVFLDEEAQLQGGRARLGSGKSWCRSWRAEWVRQGRKMHPARQCQAQLCPKRLR